MSAPRAVMVREPEDQSKPHSAVHGAVDILTDTRVEAHKIMTAWPEIAETLSLKVEEILGRETPPGGDDIEIEESS